MTDVQQPAAQPAATPSPAPATTPPAETPKPGRVNENRSGSPDPFSQAFNSAMDDMDAKARKADADIDEPEEDPETAPAAEPASPTTAPAAPQTAVEPPAPETPPAPKELPKWWSKERREAYRYQPKDVQEAWLADDPEPNSRWPAEVKERFVALPREAKEVILDQLAEADRGLNQKFQALAGERKLAEEIRSAVPEHLRATMEQRGLTEPQVFAHLLALQDQSMKDPAGFIRNFVQNNRLDPAAVFGVEAQRPEDMPPDTIRAHPEYRQLHAQFDALNRQVQAERAQRAEEESRRMEAEFEQVVQDTDGDGNPRFPYIRLLAEPMARIIESDPEPFRSMDTKSKFAAAYTQALELYPELRPVKRPTPTPPPADEPAVTTDVHAEEEAKRAETLQRAISPKSRTPLSPLPGNGKTGDPLEDALNAARRQLRLG
jgi:hypothetical protein